MPRKVTGYHETHESHVYVFVCEGYCKVGVAVDIEARLATLRCGNPFDVTCYAARKVNKHYAKEIESKVHAKLAESHHRNEWFKCDPDIARLLISETAPEVYEARRQSPQKWRAEMDQFEAQMAIWHDT